jgi:hypothetical protein
MKHKAAGGRRESDGDEGDAGAVWAFLWTLFIFKMATVVLIFWEMRTWASGLLLSVTTWYWFPLLAVMGAAPIIFRRRLMKQRARRRELLRSEWMIGPDDDDRALAELLRRPESRA